MKKCICKIKRIKIDCKFITHKFTINFNPFYLFKLDFLYFKNDCFIYVVKIKSENKLLKITDLYSM